MCVKTDTGSLLCVKERRGSVTWADGKVLSWFYGQAERACRLSAALHALPVCLQWALWSGGGSVQSLCLQWVSEPLLLVVLFVREPAMDRQTTHRAVCAFHKSGRGWTCLWDYKSHLSLKKWRQTLCTSCAHTAYFDCKLARPAKLLFLSAYRCLTTHLITFDI